MLKKIFFFTAVLVMSFILNSCAFLDDVDKLKGKHYIVVDVVDVAGNIIENGSGSLGQDGELFQNSTYYLRGTIYRYGIPMIEGSALEKQIIWADVTTGYKIISFPDLNAAKESISGDIIKITVGELQAGTTYKNIVIEVKSPFTDAPNKKYKSKVIKEPIHI